MLVDEDWRQPDARVCCGWGANGLRALAPSVDCVVVVDVLSFSTSCAVAREAGAVVLPHDPDRSVPDGVLVAGPRSLEQPSLSPSSLRRLAPGTRIVIPSLNGSRLLALARNLGVTAITGCLRDRHQVARAVARLDRVALIAAGERWTDDTVRFALEDWLGVGAIAALLTGSFSPEVVAAQAAFDAHVPDLEAALRRTASGRELVRRGFEQDVVLAAEVGTEAER
ncbi:MAG: 2-phosphosulfolactate phosphatase [Myxococcota bacterium]